MESEAKLLHQSWKESYFEEKGRRGIKAGLGSRSRLEPGVFCSLELEPLKKIQELEPLEKNSWTGATKKLAGSSALREDKKHKKIVF